MPLSKFKNLASTIATCKEPTIDIRPELLDLLREVIYLRKAATVFFQHNSSSNDLFERSNEGHLHTIEVLEEVLAELSPLRKTEPVPRPSQPADTSTAAAEQPNNIFDALDIEDIAEPVAHYELVKASTGKKTRGKAKSNAKALEDSFELSSPKEELFFTLFCFFKDLHDIQAYLVETWTEFKEGKIPITSAAVTTDLAFDIVKRKEEEMLQSEWLDTPNGQKRTLKEALADLPKTRTTSAVPLYWRLEKEGQVLNYGYVGELLYSYISGLDGNKLVESDEVDEAIQDRMYHVADWLFIPSYIMLDCADAASGRYEGYKGAPQSLSHSFAKRHGEVAKRMPNATAVSKHEHSTYVVPLLSLVRSAIAEDEEHLAFDYFAMHLCCWNLLRILQTELRNDFIVLREVIGQDLLRQDQLTRRMIPPIVFQCIETLSKGSRFAGMALKVQKVVRAFAVNQGSVGLDLVKQRETIDEVETELGIDVAADDVILKDPDSKMDAKDLAMLSRVLDLAPKRSVTDEEVQQAYSYVKETPLSKMSREQQEYFQHVQKYGGDVAEKGLSSFMEANFKEKDLAGHMAATFNATAALTDEQQERVLQTTTLREYLDLMKTFEKEAAADGRVVDLDDELLLEDRKRKRNNKNKNKNRKLRQKEEKAAAAGRLVES